MRSAVRLGLAAIWGTAAISAIAADAPRFPIMGTTASFRFSGNAAAVAAAERAAHREFDRISECCNLHDPKSELSRLNASAAKAPFACSETLYAVLREARRAWVESEGAFDITAKPLMDLWGFYRKRAAEPSPAEIAAALASVGLEKVEFDDAAKTVRFTRSGMAFDLGGIAKGAAVDRAFAAASLRLDGLLIDLGGNLRMRAPAAGRAFRIGIRDPFGGTAPVRAEECREGAFSTSGGYERFVTYGGVRYAHIIDPRTGRPGQGRLAVTVISDRGAEEADWMSTAVFLRGRELAEKLHRLHPKCRFILFEYGIRPGEYRRIVIGGSSASPAEARDQRLE